MKIKFLILTCSSLHACYSIVPVKIAVKLCGQSAGRRGEFTNNSMSAKKNVWNGELTFSKVVMICCWLPLECSLTCCWERGWHQEAFLAVLMSSLGCRCSTDDARVRLIVPCLICLIIRSSSCFRNECCTRYIRLTLSRVSSLTVRVKVSSLFVQAWRFGKG